jgi:hypothetical protein
MQMWAAVRSAVADSDADEKKAVVQTSGVKSLASKSPWHCRRWSCGWTRDGCGVQSCNEGWCRPKMARQDPLAAHCLSWLHRCNERQHPCMMPTSTNGYPGKPVARIFLQLSDAAAQKALSLKDSC